MEFRHPHVFSFSNYNDPDPLWSCVIEKTSGGCWVFADDNCDGLSEEERVLAGANRLEHPRYLRRDKVADPPRRARPIVINPYRLPTVPSSRQ